MATNTIGEMDSGDPRQETSGWKQCDASFPNLGIHINKEKQQKGGDVPYRDSKLTRMLQDSRNGNSKTVMLVLVLLRRP
ncbi:hypothetical protein ACOSQ2_023235 [Xanthoceras sorbifolium]